jgi:ABC-2 type transport system permease protein
MSRIRTIIEKEWAELFKNKIVLMTIGIVPVFFTALPLIMLAITQSTGGIEGDSTDIPAQFAQSCKGVSAQDCLQIFMANEFLLIFMMMPLIIPVAIAAYSIVGEKTTRSLEPLLATPITTMELLIGKSLAAVIPAVAATWGCFGIFLLLLPFTGVSQGVLSAILGPVWLLSVLILGPLMAVASVNLAVVVSSRVNDPRVAEQISSVLIVPLMAVLFGQLAGFIVLNAYMLLAAIVVLVLIDIGMIYIGDELFQRETILTRWK